MILGEPDFCAAASRRLHQAPGREEQEESDNLGIRLTAEQGCVAERLGLQGKSLSGFFPPVSKMSPSRKIVIHSA